MYKRLVRMVLEKFGEFCDINIASDFEEFGMHANSFIGDSIFKFGLRRTRQRFSEKGITSSRTDVIINSAPDKISHKLGAHILATHFNPSSYIPSLGGFCDRWHRGGGSGTQRLAVYTHHCSTVGTLR